MDRCEDGSIFIDRDGEHFGQVLEYMRDGVLSMADLDVSVLRWLKREMGFYCIEVMTEPQEVAFVVGGRDDNMVTLPLVEWYDVASGEWREAAPMATARVAFGLCELNGEFYVTGGVSADDVTLANVERYDPSLDTWSAAPAMPHPRYAHCACAVGDVMYVLGGIEEIEGRERTVSSVLRFDSHAQTWSEVAPMPAGREFSGACVVGGGIYIFGGRDDASVSTTTTYRFSTETNTWATLSPMPEVRQFHSVCVLDGYIYVMGGGNDNLPLSSVHRFDPVADSWSEVAPMFMARTGFGTFVLGGSIHVVGGFDGESSVTSMERYCVASDSWSEVRRGEPGKAKSALSTIVMRVDVDVFDSLMVLAKRARQGSQR
jgi:kelch-like protein 8